MNQQGFPGVKGGATCSRSSPRSEHQNDKFQFSSNFYVVISSHWRIAEIVWRWLLISVTICVIVHKTANVNKVKNMIFWPWPKSNFPHEQAFFCCIQDAPGSCTFYTKWWWHTDWISAKHTYVYSRLMALSAYLHWMLMWAVHADVRYFKKLSPHAILILKPFCSTTLLVYCT